MRLTQKLLKHTHSVFDRSSEPFLALRINYAGAMVWTVKDEVLTTAVAGGVGVPLAVDLSQHTIISLATYIAAQPGYSVAYQDASALANLKAQVLIDATGNQASSNGDHLYGYTSLLWWYLDAMAGELAAAELQITEMLRQMSIVIGSGLLPFNLWAGPDRSMLFGTTIIGAVDQVEGAADIWLDEHGSYYNVPRQPGENDDRYGLRIVAEVLRPRCNNRAIQLAILNELGISISVIDVGPQSYAGDVPSCAGLFDIRFETDSIVTLDPGFTARVHAIVDQMRAAGTFMRYLMVDLVYDGRHNFDGSVQYNAQIL